MQNSMFDPQNRNQYIKNNLQVNHVGFLETCTAGQTKNIDYSSADDQLLVGMMLACKGQAFGDKVTVQAVHPLYGVVMTFVTNWRIFDGNQLQVNDESIFPAKVTAGLIVRVVYESIGQTDVQVIVNFKLCKVLI